MERMKRVPKTQLDKAREKMKSKSKVKITGTATTTPRVSASMIKAQPITVSKPKRATPVSRSLPSLPKKSRTTPLPKTTGRRRKLIGGM
jgi:hypothetical protein